MEDELADVRGRGVGKRCVLDHWEAVVAAQESGESEVELPSVTRFIGAKTAIHPRLTDDGLEYIRSVDYGEWITRPVKLSFNPAPKRDENFQPWKLPVNATSAPYDTGLDSEEALELRQAALEAEEQPDVE